MNAPRLVACLFAGVALLSCRGADVPPTQPPAYPQQPPPGYYYPPPGYAYPQQPPPPGYYYPPGYAYPQQPAPAPQPQMGDRFAAAREQCVTLTNNYRARVGMKPVARRADKDACADAEAAADGRSGQAHGAFGTFCKGAGAQNECPGWSAANPERSLAECLESMFQEGPGEPYSAHGHYLNMTSSRYSGVVCGFAITDKGSLWIVQNFF